MTKAAQQDNGSKESRLLGAYKQATDNGELCKRSYAEWKDVWAAGRIALQCGHASTTPEELEEMKPALNGPISIRQGEGAHPSKYHLTNRLVEGYLAGGNVETLEDAAHFADMLVVDNGWRALAEQALLKAVLPFVKTPADVVDVYCMLETDRARAAFEYALRFKGFKAVY